MKNKVLSSIVFFVLGGLLAIGPYTIFPVCGAGMMAMNCQDTAKAELVLGILITVIAILSAVIKHRARIWLSAAAIPIGLLSFLFPNVITGVCGNAHMACRSLSLPALSIISIVLTLFAVFNALYLWKFRDKGDILNAATIDVK